MSRRTIDRAGVSHGRCWYRILGYVRKSIRQRDLQVPIVDCPTQQGTETAGGNHIVLRSCTARLSCHATGPCKVGLILQH